MRAAAGGSLLLVLALAGCDSSERNALEETANGGNATVIDQTFREEAQAVLEPLAPPAPGTPGGLPATRTPAAEGTIDPKSAQGAAQLVQGYYGLLEEKRFGEAQHLWRDEGAMAAEDPTAFAAHFAGFSEIHANVGSPTDGEGAAGSVFTTVPVQVYARVAANGKPWYRLRDVTLRRVNDVPGSSDADRKWHIVGIEPHDLKTG